MYCRNCGAEIPENAKFCSKCGTSIEHANVGVDNSQAREPSAQSVPATEKPPKKPIDFGKFNKYFWLIYITLGVSGYLLIELASAYTTVSTGFAIALGVISILVAIAFCSVGIVRFVSFFKESEETRKKHSLVNTICMTIGIILFVYVVLASIVVFGMTSALSEILAAFGK